jgi:hypothetical protein
MEKSLLIGAIIHKKNRDNEYPDLMIVDKVIISNGSSSSTKYLAVDKSGYVYDIYYDDIQKIVSFSPLSPPPNSFINSSAKKD